MGRPKGADAAVTRRRILAAAARHFGAKGRDGASVREIGRDAGVAVSTIHHHFGSKAGLYDATLREMYEELRVIPESVMAASRNVKSLGDVLPTLTRTAFLTARKHRDALRLVVQHGITDGVVPETVEQVALVPVLGPAGKAVAALTGTTEAQARFTLMSINHVIARYALTASSELAFIVGLPRETPEAEVLDAVAEHLGRLSTALLVNRRGVKAT